MHNIVQRDSTLKVGRITNNICVSVIRVYGYDFNLSLFSYFCTGFAGCNRRDVVCCSCCLAFLGNVHLLSEGGVGRKWGGLRKIYEVRGGGL